MKMRCLLFALFVVQAPARPGFRAAPPLFQRYCGTCHSKDIATLQEYSPERIYESITVGKMKAEAADVPDVQKRQIAEFLSARPMGSDEAGDMKKMTNPCRTNPPMTDPSAGPGVERLGQQRQEHALSDGLERRPHRRSDPQSQIEMGLRRS